MSGHSKWANIKHRKSAVDAKRGKLFTKIAREIQAAARVGGPDPDSNIRLRFALDKARAANMPKDNIQRAINRGAGLEKGADLEEITYEGYAPHGVAVIVEVLTDNKNRTVAELRHVFTKAGGNLAANGAVAWQFERKGQLTVKMDGVDEDELFLVAADAGAEDVDFDAEDVAVITTADTDLGAVRDALIAEGYEVGDVELTMVPKTEVDLPVDQAMKVMGLLEKLEDLDDVQKVHSNLAMSDELFAELEAA
jgi:YebC/PmpR family DNA-binding regulatory protein